MSPSFRRPAVVSIAGLILAVLVAAPVSARPLAHEHYSGSDSGSWDGCGLLLEWESSWHGLFTLKSGRAGDPTPYLTDNYEWDTLNVNPANGKWFTEHGQGQYKDLRITLLEGTTYRFIAQESGYPYMIQTSDGQTIVQDHGLLRYQFDVDTKGDDDLGNDEFIEGSDLLLADHGGHPVWHMTGEDYCALVNDLLGD